MHSLFSSLPALLRPSAPSYKRPYSPSPLRALVSIEYSSKRHHPARTLSPGTRASKLEMSPCAGVTTGKDAGPGNWKGNCESATMLRSSQVSVPWVSLPSVIHLSRNFYLSIYLSVCLSVYLSIYLSKSQVSVPWVSLPSVKPSRVSHRVCRIACVASRSFYYKTLSLCSLCPPSAAQGRHARVRWITFCLCGKRRPGWRRDAQRPAGRR